MPHATVIQSEADMGNALPNLDPMQYGQTEFEKLLGGWCDDQLTHAKSQTEDILKRCSAALAAKQRSSRMVTQTKGKGDLGTTIYDSEAADQVDDATGLQKDLIFQDGRIARIDYGPSERAERAMVIQMALDDQLYRGNIEDHVESALHRFVLYPYSGFKAVRDFKYGKPTFSMPAINPQVMLFSDVGRALQDQYSLHEGHFYTKTEMRRSQFKNLDKLNSADGNGRNSIYDSAARNGSKPTGGPNETFEVYETWGEPPVMEWLESGKVTPEMIAQFAALHGFGPEELLKDEGCKHCFFHKDRQILKWHPNYLLDKYEYPYYISSHYPAEGGLCGEAQMERVADAHNAVHIILNDAMDNARMIGNQSMFYRTSAGVSQEMLDRLTKPRGRVPVPGNDDLESMFMFFKPENIIPDLMSMLNYFKGRIKEGGIDDVLKGKAKPRTATQSENDNARQQSTINNSGTRFVRQALKPAVRAVTHMIIGNYAQKDWHEIAGEDGVQMNVEPWMVDPCTIDKHFQIIPVASFDFLSSAQKIQEIVNIVNVFAMFLQPQQGIAAFEEALKMTSLKKHQIDRILNSVGTATDALEEINTMIDNPWTEIEVLPMDDHRTALMISGQAMMTYPQLAQQTNFQKWELKHKIYLFQQMQMEAMQQAASGKEEKGEGGGSKGGGKQMSSEGGPMDQVGQARQQAQLSSPPDASGMAGGMTGMAVANAGV